MAKVNLGILDGFIGKVGTVVGAFWKGKPVMRAYVRHSSSSESRSQAIVRTRFGAIGSLSSVFLNAIRIGFGNEARRQKMTEVDVFVKQNWPQVQATAPDAVTIDYTGLSIAKGSLKGVDFGNPQFDNPLEVTVDITPNTEAIDADADDLVYLFVYCPDLVSSLLATPVTRSTATVTLSVPNTWNGQRVYLWGFTVGDASFNKGKVSNSAYIGSGTIS